MFEAIFVKLKENPTITIAIVAVVLIVLFLLARKGTNPTMTTQGSGQ